MSMGRVALRLSAPLTALALSASAVRRACVSGAPSVAKIETARSLRSVSRSAVSLNTVVVMRSVYRVRSAYKVAVSLPLCAVIR